MVDLPASVMKVMVRHKGQQAERRLQMGEEYHNQDLVICQENGDPITPNALTRAFTELRKTLGLAVTLHGLRHSHASDLMRKEVHIKVVSERLGHSTPAFTLKTYSHLLPSQQEEAARRIDESLRHAVGDD